jgi:hypothetical protein
MPKNKHKVLSAGKEIEAALQRAREFEREDPRAEDAQYDAEDDSIVVHLPAGVKLSIPRTLIQGLAEAEIGDVAEIEVIDEGTVLSWPRLNLEHYVLGLSEGLFGTKKWMAQLGRKGGSSTSEAKRIAARENGRKGGRPRTVVHRVPFSDTWVANALTNAGFVKRLWNSPDGKHTEGITPSSNTPEKIKVA